jgi:hypothetical protein
VAAQVRASAQDFLNMFNNTTDRVALIHFSNGAEVDVPFKSDQSRGFDRTTMNAKIQAYTFGAMTNYSEALWQARDQLNRVITTANRSSMRVIVFFSDGAPNGFASYFTFKNISDCSSAGTISAYDLDTAFGTFNLVSGLYRHDRQNQTVSSGNCYHDATDPITDYLTSTAVPDYYNAHSKTDTEFRLVPAPAGMRNVTKNPNWANFNRLSRNLAEQMTDKSRSEGIYVLTLGLGSEISSPSGPDNETGETLLKNMAHATDSAKFGYSQYAGQPVGKYCYAATVASLTPCFTLLASDILRISQ